jgi:hypothetical protein
MFDHTKLIARSGSRSIRAAILALVTMLTGCDKKAEWRGVETDAKDADRPSDQPNPGGAARDARSP